MYLSVYIYLYILSVYIYLYYICIYLSVYIYMYMYITFICILCILYVYVYYMLSNFSNEVILDIEPNEIYSHVGLYQYQLSSYFR